MPPRAGAAESAKGGTALRGARASFCAGLKAGFFAVLLLLGGATLIGISRTASINQHVARINESTVKIALANDMKNATRDRAILMHSIALGADAFDQQDELQRFYDKGSAFSNARLSLTRMQLGEEEEKSLARIREATVKTQPMVLQAIDTALAGNHFGAQTLIATGIVPLQREIAASVDELVELQQREIAEAMREVARAYSNTRLLMLLFGGSAMVLGIVITVVVARGVDAQARLLEKQATFDNLTQLPNRMLFEDRLERALVGARRDNASFAVMLMDLNRFKEINDTLGHGVGDLVLQHVASQARACLRESDTVARMGGDEFVILLSNARTPEGAEVSAMKILQALSTPLQAAGRNLEVGGSIGIAMFPQHGESSAELLRNADAAMYAAKRANCGYQVYGEEPGHGVAGRGDAARRVAPSHLEIGSSYAG